MDSDVVECLLAAQQRLVQHAPGSTLAPTHCVLTNLNFTIPHYAAVRVRYAVFFLVLLFLKNSLDLEACTIDQ